MKYTNKEKTDMILIYGEVRKNSVHAKALYKKRYPGRQQPSNNTFQNLFQTLYEAGTFRRVSHDKNSVKEMSYDTDDSAFNSDISSLEEYGIRDDKNEKVEPYKFHSHHISLYRGLHGNDFFKRIGFCKWSMEHKNFFQRILFNNVSTFTNYGEVYKRDMHYWSTKNTYWLKKIENQKQWSLNVWCGIINERIIGPYFINGTLTAEKQFVKFLQETLGSLLEDVSLEIRCKMWYQHEGCSTIMSKQSLHQMFPKRWIGQGGPVNWPFRSPDLNPVDFFLWRTLKTEVYQKVPTTPEDMQFRIRRACLRIKPDTMRTVSLAFEQRLKKCLHLKGHYFENKL